MSVINLQDPKTAPAGIKRIGDTLVSLGVCTEELVNEALMLQEISPDKLLGEILLEKRYITEDDLARAVAEQYACGFAPLIDIKAVDSQICKKISVQVLIDKCFIILKSAEKYIVVAYKPDFEISTALVKAGIVGYEFRVSTKTVIYDAINSRFGADKESLNGKQTPAEIIKEVIMIAIAKKSANIRIKFTNESFYINIDTQFGTTEPIKTVSVESGRAVVRVLTEYCEPKINLVPGYPASSKFILEGYDIRVEFLPIETHLANNIFEAVLRIHYSYSKEMFNLSNLGFTEEEVAILKSIKNYSNGIIFWTGPTGSGKTTTIYAVLKYLSQTRKQIFTIEDPVENRMSDINITQLQVKEQFGFSNAIRTVLRCEPKILMIGEIRDKETAETAATASETGHLVLTTLHTNSALSFFKRLEALGVKPDRIIENTKIVMAQRLYLPLCPYCRTEREIKSDDERALSVVYENLKTLNLEVKKIELVFERQRTGCAHCNYTGYGKERRAAIEIAVFDELLRDFAVKNTLFDTEHAFAEKGFIPLKFKAYNLLEGGVIDLNQFYTITNR
ncbi:MAG: ATPase, T2SS/T4P/T4SS family [Deltaproteobacteria bacterium]|jgi:type IV pilus assembly protein PilB|nr:ATPase, T2SS/T4P/T4SS family [Deltaproteobacteria bacterium]